jgi:CRP-like cAMP-binding protein
MKYLEVNWTADTFHKLEIMRCLPAAILNNCRVPMAIASPGDDVSFSDPTGSPCICVLLEGTLIRGNVLSQIRGMPVRSGDMAEYRPGDCLGVSDFLRASKPLELFRAVSSVKLLLLDSTSFFNLVSAAPQLAAAIFNSRSVREPLLLAERERRLARQYSTRFDLENERRFFAASWLETSFPDILRESIRAGAELIMLSIHVVLAEGCDGNVVCVAERELAKILNSALRPTDSSARYRSGTVLTVLPHTSHHSALVVKRRIEDRVARTVLFGDMHRSLPHFFVNINMASSLQFSDAQRLIAEAMHTQPG